MVAPLSRMEFLSCENQIYVMSGFEQVPQVANQWDDLIYEDRRLHVEDSKKLIQKRRDLLFSTNDGSRGSFFVFEVMHQRSLKYLICKSRDPVTNKRFPGRLVCHLCDVASCREEGPCHRSVSEIDGHNLNK